MSHPYVNDLIAMFDGFTEEVIEESGNVRFIKRMVYLLVNSFNIPYLDAVEHALQMTVELSDDLTDEDIERLAEATNRTIVRMCDVLAKKLNITPESVLKRLPKNTMKVSLS